jgi:hypothetical protein
MCETRMAMLSEVAREDTKITSPKPQQSILQVEVLINYHKISSIGLQASPQTSVTHNEHLAIQAMSKHLIYCLKKLKDFVSRDYLDGFSRKRRVHTNIFFFFFPSVEVFQHRAGSAPKRQRESSKSVEQC